MTRNIFSFFVICFALLLFAAGCNEQGKGSGVALVDAEKVFKGSKVAKEAMDYIEAMNTKFSERVGEMQAELGNDMENEELSTKLQAEFMQLQADFEREQNEIGEKLNKHFEDALDEYRVKNNLEVILPSQMVMSSSANADISDAIIAIMDAKTLNLPAVTAKDTAEQTGNKGDGAAPASDANGTKDAAEQSN